MNRLRLALAVAVAATVASPGIVRAAGATPTPAPELIPVASPAPASSPAQPSFGTLTVESPAPARLQTPGPAPTAAPEAAAPGPISTSLVEDPAISQRAREWLLRLQSDEIDRKQIDAKFNAQISNGDFKKLAQQITSFGTLVSFTFVEASTYPEGVVYEYAAHFATTPGHWYFAVDNEGKIGGMHILTLRP